MKLEDFKELVQKKKVLDALDIAEHITPKDRYFYYEKSKALLSIGNHEDSLKNIDKVLELKPDWLGAHSIKVSILTSLKREPDLINALVSMITASKEITDKDEVFSTLFNQLLDCTIKNKISLISFCLEYYKYINGSDSLYLFFSGIIDSSQGHLDTAAKKLSLLTSDSIKNLGRHATGALSFRYSHELERISSNLRDYTTKINFLKDCNNFNDDYSEIVFAACDSKYFDMFSEVFISSFAYNLTSKICHIHVVNPTKSTIEKANIIASSFANFNFSYEHSRFNEAIYFATARFLTLETILDFYGKDVLVCDIDAAFLADFSISEILSQNFDLVIKADDQCGLALYPWRGLAAGFLAVKNNDRAKDFIRSLKSYILNFLLDAQYDNIWYFDQTALYCLLNFFSERKLELRTRFIHGETSKIIIYPDAKKETKEEFAIKHNKIDIYLTTL